MTVLPSLVFGLCLVLGSLLAIGAGLLHADLAGADGATQLAAIAASERWSAIHWAFLFSFPLALTGLVGVVRRHAATAGENAVRAAVLVATFAYAGWVVIVAFMGGTGAALAHSYAAAEPGMTATRAVFMFDMLRPFALAAQRSAGFALGLATALFGWGILDAKVLPRWLGTGGVAAGVVGIVLALVFREDTKADQAAFVLPVLWQLAAGVVLVRPRPGRDSA
jgi:Domain of unknown function (DUF4386)